MKLEKIWHLNNIGHEINESLRFGYPVSDREIYCKKTSQNYGDFEEGL